MERFILLAVVCLVPTHAVDALSPTSSEAVRASSAALSWLLSLRRPDGGWGGDTARVVTALNLVNSSALSRTDHELTEKQLQIELLTDVWTLAEYVMALVSSCINVTDFDGRNLISMMRHRATSDDSEVAPVVLASCLAGEPLRRRRYLRLLTTIEGELADDVSAEVLALAVLELRCETLRGGRRAERHRLEAARRLASKQQPDGGYGDLDSTLLAHQALRGAEAPGWDSAASLRYILSRQRPDGSLGSVRLTAAAAWVLAGRSLLQVPDTACHHRGDDRAPADPDNKLHKAAMINTASDQAVSSIKVKPSPLPSASQAALPSVDRPANLELPQSPRRIWVTLWLWIGSRPDQIYSQRISVPEHTSAFECMKLVARYNPHFNFSSELWPTGHYIHTIGGHREEKDGYHFWVLYRLDSPPDPASRPTQRDVHTTGVDRLLPPDGGHVLFWYREV